MKNLYFLQWNAQNTIFLDSPGVNRTQIINSEKHPKREIGALERIVGEKPFARSTLWLQGSVG